MIIDTFRINEKFYTVKVSPDRLKCTVCDGLMTEFINLSEKPSGCAFIQPNFIFKKDKNDQILMIIDEEWIA